MCFFQTHQALSEFSNPSHAFWKTIWRPSVLAGLGPAREILLHICWLMQQQLLFGWHTDSLVLLASLKIVWGVWSDLAELSERLHWHHHRLSERQPCLLLSQPDCGRQACLESNDQPESCWLHICLPMPQQLPSGLPICLQAPLASSKMSGASLQRCCRGVHPSNGIMAFGGALLFLAV